LAEHPCVGPLAKAIWTAIPTTKNTNNSNCVIRATVKNSGNWPTTEISAIDAFPVSTLITISKIGISIIDKKTHPI
jgi:hypothetical protein